MDKDQGEGQQGRLSGGESVTDYLTRMRRQISLSTNSWQKLCNFQPLFSRGNSASLIHIGSTIQHRISSVGGFF